MEFSAKVDDAYKEILAQLRRKNPDLAALARRYQQVLAQISFDPSLAKKCGRHCWPKEKTQSEMGYLGKHRR